MTIQYDKQKEKHETVLREVSDMTYLEARAYILKKIAEGMKIDFDELSKQFENVNVMPGDEKE